MLEHLRIRNLAVVEDAELDFGPGLNVLTGATGAGKSLILGAVNLLLGEKASTDAIRSGEDHAEVEARFTVAGGRASSASSSATTTLRRVIRTNGGGVAARTGSMDAP